MSGPDGPSGWSELDRTRPPATDGGAVAATDGERSAVTKAGVVGARPGREAITGGRGPTPQPKGGSRRGGAEAAPKRRRRRPGGKRSAEEAMVPAAEFRSYYGLPVLNGPTWEARDIAGYLFLGGLAGGSAVIGAAASATARPGTARAAKVAAVSAIGASAAALVHDLGRPSRFLNMLRVFKPTSPMSVGSWLLAGFGPAAGVAAVSEVTGWFPRLGRSATVAGAVLGPAVAAYTGVLVADTAVPAWHDAHRHLPYAFVASGASAASGLALLVAPSAETGPARRSAVVATALEQVVLRDAERRMEPEVGRAYRSGRAGRLLRTSRALGAAGAGLVAAAGPRRPSAARVGGAALVASSAFMRFGVFEAGVASAKDPAATIGPQRRRRDGWSSGEPDALGQGDQHPHPHQEVP